MRANTNPTANTPTNSNFTTLLNQLSEFPHALIYGFDFEGAEGKNKEGLIGHLQQSAGQFQDMLNAYTYAQNEILPSLRHGLDKITSKQIQTWIKKIHKLIAATMSEDSGHTAGVYRVIDIIRWEPSNQLDLLIQRYLIGMIPKSKLLDFGSKHHVDLPALEILLNVLERLKKDTSITLTKSRMESIEKMAESKEHKIIMIAINKFAQSYYQYLRTTETSSNAAPVATKEEWEAIRKIANISPDFENVPQLMHDFSTQLVEKLKTCDGTNTEQLLDLIYFTFFHTTEIHSFWNANGRTATCIMNCFLRAFNKPAILLRNPNERDNHESSYAQAIKQISSQSGLFNLHVKRRMEEEKPYQSDALRETVQYRVANYELTQKLKKHFTQAQLEAMIIQFAVTAMAQYPDLAGPQVDENQMSDETFAILQKEIYHQFLALNAKFNLNKPKQPKATTHTSSVTSVQYSDSDISQIIDILEKITHEFRFDAFRKNGVTLLLYLPDSERAQNVARILENTEAMKITLMQNPTTKLPVLKLEDLNFKKLQELDSLLASKKTDTTFISDKKHTA